MSKKHYGSSLQHWLTKKPAGDGGGIARIKSIGPYIDLSVILSIPLII
jgi:hypothetical protein